MKRLISFICCVASLMLAHAQITINQRDLEIAVGESVTVSCTYTGRNSLNWSSSDSSVATVTGNGKTATITGVSDGMAYIMVEEKTSGNNWSSAYDYIYVTVKGEPEPPLTDADLPFIPTSVAGGSLADDTHWYILTLRNKYVYENDGLVQCSATEPIYDGKTPLTQYLWALTGNMQTGFRFYNYNSGASLLGSVQIVESGEKAELNGAYFLMLEEGAVDSNNTYFMPTRNDDGLTFTLVEEEYGGLNDFNSAGIVRVWDSYRNLTDGGACFRFYEADPIAFGGNPVGEVVQETGVKLSETILNLSSGDTHQLTATIQPENATYRILKWSSDNEKVATVSANGLVTARAAGTATITVTTHAGLTATVRVTVTFVSSAEGLCINEVQASNVDQYLDPSYNYGGWLELYNSSNSSINLRGFYLTDDLDEPQKWPLSSLDLTYADYQQNSRYTYEPNCETSSTVPAKGYSLIWFDHNDWRYPMMCPFKLDCDGGNIYVTDGNNIVAECAYPESITRASWARTTNGGDTWKWTSEPTPKASNASSTFASARLDAPTVSEDSRVFTDGSFTVHVQWPSGSTLRYTTDGSTPTATHGETSTDGQFPVSETTILRLCAVQSGKLTSPVVTRSYIHPSYNETLPVMSLVTEEGNLYDSTYGIMTRGSNGRPGLSSYSSYGQTSNWNQDWDRPANIEYFSANGKMLFNQEANIAICGGWSRAYEPYSFKVKGKKQYEHMNYLPYQFFSAKPYIKNKTLQMRNGGNDNPGNGGSSTGGRFIDAGLQTAILSSGLNIDGQSYQPVHLYRNGEYKGLINMREPNNRDLVYSNYGYDDDEVDQWEMDCDSAYVQSSGTREAFERWYDLATRSSDPAVYEEVKKICDIEEFCNYMALMCYLNLSDYGYNNVKGYRPRVENGRFRMVLFDLDSSYSGTAFHLANTSTSRSWNQQFEGSNGAYGGRINSTIEFEEIFGYLALNSAEFRKQFVDQFCIIAGSVLEPSRCHAVIDSLLANVNYAASLEYNLTGKRLTTSSIAENLKSTVFTSTRINDAVSKLSSSSYPFYAACQEGRTTLSLSQNNANGRLLLNDLPIPTGRFNGRVYAPATLRAEAPAGYRFAGWKGESTDKGGTTDGDKTLKEAMPMGSTWYYYDEASLDDTSWKEPSYMGYLDWAEGKAPMGYNNGSPLLATTLDYGYDSNDKRPTYYFRQNVTLDEEVGSVEMSLHFDDGIAVYVNGQEAVRYNLDKDATYDTYAQSYPAGNYYDETFTLDAALFQKGKNIIAVEVHNCSARSTDVYFDASLSYAPKSEGSITPVNPDPSEYVSTDPEYTLPNNGNCTLEAVYVPLTEDELGLTDVHPVKVNEVSAGNSIYINDQFKKDDWVEIYNTTGHDIDLTGYYLSDKADNPTKFQIPASDIQGANILPAHGHRIVWCSKRTRTGRDIYSGFKLDNTDGACVTITAPDQSWTDTLTYQAMNGDETCGLFPDGSSSVYLMQIPTIEKANMLTMYAEWYDEHELEEAAGTITHTGKLISQSNELGINFIRDALLVTNEDFLSTTLRVYTLSGQTVLTADLDMSEGRQSVNIAHLPAGTYVATAEDSEGTSVSVKFSK